MCITLVYITSETSLTNWPVPTACIWIYQLVSSDAAVSPCSSLLLSHPIIFLSSLGYVAWSCCIDVRFALAPQDKPASTHFSHLACSSAALDLAPVQPFVPWQALPVGLELCRKEPDPPGEGGLGIWLRKKTGFPKDKNKFIPRN